ncbi:hypothetical protein [Myxococcus fulvus]|uniref:hypothetical protein n=1 Tax=Myxococcus fulvus TaxID=33 RepID=UPI0020C10D08|nr:hypothetical protein [Myxococcus fulvus]MCK8499864.1 hypothetical protein [Myxococcus fulvus]
MLSVVTDVLGDLVVGVLSVFAKDKRGGAWALGLYLLLGLGLAGALVAGFGGVSVWDWRYAFDRARFGLGFGVTLGVGLGRVIGLLVS